MPTVLGVGPYRFYFYASDRSEPVHIHVEGNGGSAKFWLEPVRLQGSRGLARHELSRLAGIVAEHQQEFARAWHEYFKG